MDGGVHFLFSAGICQKADNRKEVETVGEKSQRTPNYFQRSSQSAHLLPNRFAKRHPVKFCDAAH